MITNELVQYIKTELAKGTTREQMTQVLVSHGWNLADVEQGLAQAMPATVPPVPVVPVATPSVTPPVTTLPTTAPMQAPVVTAVTMPVSTPAVSSPVMPASTETFFGYAGFWQRFAAMVIDGGIIAIPTYIILIILIKVIPINSMASLIVFQAIQTWVQVVIGILTVIYLVLSEASAKQGTIGKSVVGIKVTDLSGSRISIPRSIGRYLSKIISAIVLLIGFIMVGFTEKKQGLHDMIAGTLVVKTRPVNTAKNILYVIAIVVVEVIFVAIFMAFLAFATLSNLSAFTDLTKTATSTITIDQSTVGTTSVDMNAPEVITQ